MLAAQKAGLSNDKNYRQAAEDGVEP